MVDPVLHLWLVEIPKEHKTDLWLSRISSFVSVFGVYVGLPSELSIPNSFIKQSRSLFVICPFSLYLYLERSVFSNFGKYTYHLCLSLHFLWVRVVQFLISLQCLGIESVDHFFLKCNIYTEHRIQLFRGTSNFRIYYLEMPLFENDKNSKLFLLVQKYIANSKRFVH